MSEPRPEYLTVSQAAARLGISARAVQKRCVNGTLAARRVSTPAGDRWEVEAANLPANLDASWTRTDEPKGREPRELGREPNGVLNSKEGEPTREQGANLDANPRTIGREQDANTRELLAQSREEILFLRGLVEQRDRDAGELRAALRKALDAMPKAITAGNESAPIEAATAPENAQVKETTPAAIIGAQRREKRPKLTAWQKVAARILRIR
jgi:hypothetical protein